jgi:hypothetical protein
MSSCSGTQIDLVWRNTPRSTLTPINADFTYAAGKYDLLTCEFNSDTAQKIRDNIELLNQTRAVEVKLAGETIRTMYFHPRNIRIGKDLRDSEYGGYLELHDLHEFFASGAIDKDFDNERVKTIYKEIFRKRQGEKDPFTNDTPIFKFGQNRIAEEGYQAYSWHIGDEGKWMREDGRKTDLDIKDESTVLEALKQVNNELSLSTRINPEGEFVVGGYDGRNDWIANETGTGSDYLIKSAGISQAYKKDLKRVNIIGPIEVLGAPKTDFGRAAGSLGSALNPFDDPQESGYQLRAIVEDPEVEDGKIVTKEMTSTHPEKIEEIAQGGIRKFLQVDSQKQTGNITIDMEASSIKDVPDIGDILHVPEPESCNLLEGPAYRADVYSIYSVRHKLSGGWTMELEIESIPISGDSLEFRIGYIDNATGDIYEYEDVVGYEPDPQSIAYGGGITQEDIDG